MAGGKWLDFGGDQFLVGKFEMVGHGAMVVRYIIEQQTLPNTALAF